MSIKKIHVLLVEDTVIAGIAGSAVLEDLGCEVTLVSTGRQAIEKTQQAPQPYDLILMDLGLPDVDALTVTENILANYKLHKKTPPPIIALTAYAQESLQADCMKAGMVDFLAKPLTKDIAQTILNKVLGHE
ncbi:MAG: response regulator [Pseudomonadota bacterium]